MEPRVYDAAEAAAWDMFDSACDYDGSYADFAHNFATGAEWYAAGMAVCAFLEDLAALLDMESPAPQVCQCCGQYMLCTSCGVG